jgi:tetratricopeptide (TPR) repeat protein
MPTAEHYEALSAAYYRAGRFHECIHAAEHALSVQPDSANAYVDEAAGYIKLGEWNEAIAAADQAIRLDPDLQLAWNNRAYAEEQKDKRQVSLEER